LGCILVDHLNDLFELCRRVSHPLKQVRVRRHFGIEKFCELFLVVQKVSTGILRMNSEPPRIFAFSPRLGKPGWRRGRLSSPLTLRTAAEGADLAIFANIWTHSSLRSPLNA
jgi:hypothetical protein